MLILSLQDGIEVQLEHSLASLSKWEQIYEKPFSKMPQEDTGSYIEQMLLSPSPSVDWVAHLSPAQHITIVNYINSSQTATTFRDDPSAKPSKDVITNEVIYSWMIKFGIPFDPCQGWHLSRLMTLIKIRGIQETPAKKMTRAQQAAEYRRLNEERRQQLGTSG